MFDRLNHRRWHYLVLTALGGVLFLINLGGASLWDVDEGRNATAAWEMMMSGNYIIPTFNAHLRVDKPALLYWLQILAYRTFGVSEFSARLPSALAAVAVLLLCYELGRRMFNRTTGLLAGVIVASTPMMCGAARFANPDSLLNCCTVLALLMFWLTRTHPGALTYLGLGVAAGLGVLAKGPVGFVLPASVMGLFLLWEGSWRRWWTWRGHLAVWVMLLVALPWYVWVALDTKASFLRGFIMNHNVGRFLSPMENHHGSPLYYPGVLLIGLAPWSVFLGPALWCGFWSAIRRPWTRFEGTWRLAADGAQAMDQDAKQDAAAYRFLACWILVYLLFFTLAATKLPNYVLPLVVPCALLVGRFLERWRQGELRVPGWVIPTCLACLGMVGLVLGLGLATAGGLWDLPMLRGRVFDGLAPWALSGTVPLAGALAAWVCWRRQRRGGVIASVALSAILLLGPLAAYASAVFNRYKAPAPLVEAAGACQRYAEVRIGCYGLEYLPSLNFYVQREVFHLQGEEDVRDFLRCPLPVYLFMTAAQWQQLEGSLGQFGRVSARHHDLYRHGEVVVITNQK